MTRILRDHGKIIMTVLGVVLMFVFALPTFRGMSPDEVGKMTVATLNGRKISNNDLHTAQAELGLLTGLDLLGTQQRGDPGSPEFTLATEVVGTFGGDDQERGTYWMLLTEEASHYAYTSVGDAEVERAAAVMGHSRADINAFVDKQGTGMVFLRQAVSHLEMVEQYLNFLVTLGPRPVSSLELSGDEDLRKVNLKFAAIDGAKGWQQESEPTAEQISKQYDLYKHTVRTPMPPADATSPGPQPPEIDGHHYPFGYKYPDRVTVEFLEFNRAALRALIKPTQEDYSKAFSYYKDHPEEFQTTATQPATASAPASAPAATQPTTRPWDDAKQELVDRQIDQRTDLALVKMLQTATEMAGEPWKNDATVSKDKWVSYETIAAAIAANPDFFKYKPEVKQPEGLKGPEQLRELEGIGQAVYLLPVGTQQALVPFAALATHVQELVKSDPKDPLARLNLQVGTEGPTLRDTTGNQYMYRVTSAEPTHEPASIDEVKAQVVEDLKKRAAYEKTVAAVKEALSKNPRVTAVADAYKATVVTPPEFGRADAALPKEIEAIPDFVKAAFSIDQSAQTRPANITEPGPGTVVLAVDGTLHCYPIELINYAKPTGQDFENQVKVLLQSGDPALQRFIVQYVSLEALSDRLHYVPVTPPKKPATAPASK